MSTQMTLERKKAYTEIMEILRFLGNGYSQRVPNKVKEYFENNSEKNYDFKITSNTDIMKQIQNPITINLLGMLRYNYWCDTAEEKQQLLNVFKKNDEEKEKQLREKYNPDNLFKNRVTKEDKIDNSVALVEYKESIFSKIKNWIKQLFIK